MNQEILYRSICSVFCGVGSQSRASCSLRRCPPEKDYFLANPLREGPRARAGDI